MIHRLFLIISVVVLMLASVTLLLYAGRTFSADAHTTVLSVTGAKRGTQPLAGDVKTVRFPVQVEGTTLTVNGLAKYEGDMLEDNSDTFLVDSAALELHNFGDQEISLTEITLSFDEMQLVFFGTNIPAGATVLIIEQDAKGWTDAPCIGCSGWVQYSENTALPDSAVRICDVDLGTVAVTNMTDMQMQNLWLFYKNYLSDVQIYLGGITYIEEIPALDPWETVLITPRRYASGYSKVIKAEIMN